MIRVYLAGASRELDRVLPFVDALQRSGLVTLTYDWWSAVQKHGVGQDHTLTKEQALGHAENDLAGVRTAELFWGLWPENYSLGCPLEFGFALASQIPTVITGSKASSCIFTSMATYRDPSDLCGLHEVMRRAGYFGKVLP